MGNRRHHKKLRVEVRARMARTGESYQRALAGILRERTVRAAQDVDLVQVDYFGAPVTLATHAIAGRLACVFVSSERLGGPYPKSPLAALARPGAVSVH